MIGEDGHFIVFQREVKVEEPKLVEPEKDTKPKTTEERRIDVAREFVETTSSNMIDWAELRASFAAEFGKLREDLNGAIAAMAPSIASSIARKSGGSKVALMLNGIDDNDYPDKELIISMRMYVESIRNPETNLPCEFTVCF